MYQCSLNVVLSVKLNVLSRKIAEYYAARAICNAVIKCTFRQRSEERKRKRINMLISDVRIG